MTNHRFRHMRRTQVVRFLLCVALVWGFGLATGRAGQQSTPSARVVQSVRTNTTTPAPVDPAKILAQRKSTKAVAGISSLPAGKRDPFKLPASAEGKGAAENFMASASGGPVPPGIRGLIISQLRLEGIVHEQTSNKMIAVVTNETKRAYFLSENQSVYNGTVSKITVDGVYFMENALDTNGRVTTREVVKRLDSAPGEAR